MLVHSEQIQVYDLSGTAWSRPSHSIPYKYAIFIRNIKSLNKIDNFYRGCNIKAGEHTYLHLYLSSNMITWPVKVVYAQLLISQDLSG